MNRVLHVVQDTSATAQTDADTPDKLLELLLSMLRREAISKVAEVRPTQYIGDISKEMVLTVLTILGHSYTAYWIQNVEL